MNTPTVPVGIGVNSPVPNPTTVPATATVDRSVIKAKIQAKIDRNKGWMKYGRPISSLLTLLVIMVIWTLMVWFMFSKTGLGHTATVIIILNIAFLGLIGKYFIATVPEVMGYVYLNYLTGSLNPMATGLHLKLPWEILKKKVSLQKITRPVVGKTQLGDGVDMGYESTVNYVPVVERLDDYILVEQESILKQIVSEMSPVIAAEVAKKNSGNIRTEMKSVGEVLTSEFDGQSSVTELNNGVDIINVILKDISLPEEVTAANANKKAAATRAETLGIMATEIIRAVPGISPETAANIAAAADPNTDVSRTVISVEGGLNGTDKIAALAAGLFASNQQRGRKGSKKTT